MASSLLTGIVSYWKLDESSGNPADSVGSNTLTNTNGVTFGTALINNGAIQDASNLRHFARTDALGLDLTTAFSISMWIKPNIEIASGSWGLFNICESTHDVAFRAFYEYNSGTRRLNIQRVRPNVGSSSLTSNLTIGTSNFCNVVVTYNATTVTVYVNSVSVGTFNDTGNGSAAVDKTAIGASFNEGTGNGDSFGNFTIDEVGVWSKCLTLAEVQDLYASGIGNQYPFQTYVSITSETSTGTESYSNFVLGKRIDTSETSTTTETYNITAPSNTAKWNNASKSSSTWTNQSKS